jgi:ferritin-like metal-binding protein YciE
MTQLSTLQDLYIDQLQDLYSAARQSLKATQKMREAAQSEPLQAALQRGVEGIQRGADAVSGIIRQHGANPTDEFCKGMEGLVKEVDAHVFQAEFGDADVRDAMIIAQYQRMAHYAIAGYGCVRAYAQRLGRTEEAETLQQCVAATREGDQTMTEIAEGGVNQAAMG